MGMRKSAAPEKSQKTKAYLALHLIPGLSPAASKIGALLIHHANGHTGRCDPGQTRLQALSGMSESSVKRATKELAELDLITKHYRGATTSTAYTINWSRLGKIADDFETLAKNLSARGDRGVSKLAGGGVNSATSVVSNVNPKHSEGNTLKEPLFRVGSDHGSERERTDDRRGRKVVNTIDDRGFLFSLDRAVRDRCLFSDDVAALIHERLESIHVSAEHGSTIGGLAYRLLQTECEIDDTERNAA